VEDEPGHLSAPSDQEMDSFSYVLPEPGTHWTQVRAFLLEVEADRPPDLAAIVQAVKARFPTYGRIQVEADRILSSLGS